MLRKSLIFILFASIFTFQIPIAQSMNAADYSQENHSDDKYDNENDLPALKDHFFNVLNFTKQGLNFTKRSLQKICSNHKFLLALTAIIIMNNIPVADGGQDPYQNESDAARIADLLSEDLFDERSLEQCSLAKYLYCYIVHGTSCENPDKSYVDDLAWRRRDILSRYVACFSSTFKTFYGTVAECKNSLINYLIHRYLPGE